MVLLASLRAAPARGLWRDAPIVDLSDSRDHPSAGMFRIETPRGRRRRLYPQVQSPLPGGQYV
jgi:hypothetical protein